MGLDSEPDQRISSNARLPRLAGLLYLLMMPTTGFAYGFGLLMMKGDAAATLAGIQANRSLLQWSILAGAVGFVDFLMLGVALYWLFGPVNRRAASLMLAFIAVSVPPALAALAQRMDVLSMLDGAREMGIGDQLQPQVMLALSRANNLILVSSMFWGLWMIPFGWLVWRYQLMPRIVGVLLVVGSVFYVLGFAGPVLDPHFATSLTGRVIGFSSGIPAVIGELAACLWLLIKGVDGRQTARAGSPV